MKKKVENFAHVFSRVCSGFCIAKRSVGNKICHFKVGPLPTQLKFKVFGIVWRLWSVCFFFFLTSISKGFSNKESLQGLTFRWSLLEALKARKLLWTTRSAGRYLNGIASHCAWHVAACVGCVAVLPAAVRWAGDPRQPLRGRKFNFKREFQQNVFVYLARSLSSKCCTHISADIFNTSLDRSLVALDDNDIHTEHTCVENVG